MRHRYEAGNLGFVLGLILAVAGAHFRETFFNPLFSLRAQSNGY